MIPRILATALAIGTIVCALVMFSNMQALALQQCEAVHSLDTCQHILR